MAEDVRFLESLEEKKVALSTEIERELVELNRIKRERKEQEKLLLYEDSPALKKMANTYLMTVKDKSRIRERRRQAKKDAKNKEEVSEVFFASALHVIGQGIVVSSYSNLTIRSPPARLYAPSVPLQCAVQS